MQWGNPFSSGSPHYWQIGAGGSGTRGSQREGTFPPRYLSATVGGPNPEEEVPTERRHYVTTQLVCFSRRPSLLPPSLCSCGDRCRFHERNCASFRGVSFVVVVLAVSSRCPELPAATPRGSFSLSPHKGCCATSLLLSGGIANRAGSPPCLFTLRSRFH